MSGDTRDTVEEYQDILKVFINMFMIDELLAEGNFNWNEYDNFNRVQLFIPEIDLDARIKKENHMANMYGMNMVTEDEARISIGKEPLGEADRARMFFDIITKPTLVLQGQIKAQNSANGSVSSSDTPENQHGKQLVSPRIAQDKELTDAYDSDKLQHLGFSHHRAMIEEQWRQYKRELSSAIQGDNPMDVIWEQGVSEAFLESIHEVLNTSMVVAYQLGFDGVIDASLADFQQNTDLTTQVRNDIILSIDKVSTGFNKLLRDVMSRIDASNDESAEVQATCDSLKHRIPMLLSTGLMRAKNFGRARAFAINGRPTLVIPNCPDHGNHDLHIDTGIDYDSLPPNATHPNCLCEVT